MTQVPFTALLMQCEFVCWFVYAVLLSELMAPVCGAHQSLWHVPDAQEILTKGRKELSRPGKGPQE